jgi:hypothetical protein
MSRLRVLPNFFITKQQLNQNQALGTYQQKRDTVPFFCLPANIAELTNI